MPSQVLASVPGNARHRQPPALQVLTTPDFFASLAANLAAATAADGSPSEGVRCCAAGLASASSAPCEHDYSVPAPPPPSPVSFRNDHHWYAASLGTGAKTVRN